MVDIQRYSPELREEWDELVRSAKTRLFFFERAYMEYHSDRFHDESLVLTLGDRAIGVLPASRHGDTLVSHGGLTYGGLILSGRAKATNVLDCLDSLLTYASENGIKKLHYKAVPYIFHMEPSQEDLYALFRFGAKLLRRDISSVIHLDARGRISSGRKYMLKKAQRADLKVVSSNDWHTFYGLLSKVLAQHDVEPTHSVQELQYLASHFPDHIELKIAVHNGRMLAGTVLFHFDRVTHTQYIATSEEGKDVGALDFLLESSILQSRDSGQRVFSFGISTEKQGTYLNEGLISHKEAFGARGIAVDHYEISID